jgi:acyl-coenzyme A synthetase/AMP-(fatty) acid ligase
MSAKAYARLENNARSGKSRDLFGDIHATWTRSESLDAVERIACGLDAAIDAGKAGATIGICLPRDRRYLATMFAAWARGDSFVPLNPRWPRAHLQRVLEIAQPDVIVTDGGDPGEGKHRLVTLPAIDEVLALPPPTSAQAARWRGHRAVAQRSYAIFTSGSTGGQKGVLISAGAYESYLDWAGRYWRDSAKYKSLLITAELTFDITLGDLAFALAHDVEIHVSPDPSNVFAHAKLIRDRHVNVFYSVPSTISRLFPLAQSRDDVRLDGLDLVIAGGDAFAPRLIDLVQCASPHAQFHNVYGPTEVTINCVAARVDDQRERISAAGLVPIGLPFEHLPTTLDEEEPWERAGWTQGELLVGGPQCMEGYLSDAGATARAFVERGGQRYYRTGDVVARDPDGYLYVIGRRDALVKVKGYRVNPVAVDNVLAKNAAVKESRTVFLPAGNGEGELVSFVVAAPGADVRSLMGECRTELPGYAVPARIVIVDAMPVGASGKYDNRELLAKILG